MNVDWFSKGKIIHFCVRCIELGLRRRLSKLY